MESGSSSADDSGAWSGASKQETGAASAMPMPDEPVKVHHPKVSNEAQALEDLQATKGKLASQPSVGAPPCHKRDKKASDIDLQGHSKSKNKKKNRLGQRARQQLGRAKEAQLFESRPKSAFLVSHVSLPHHFNGLCAQNLQVWANAPCTLHKY